MLHVNWTFVAPEGLRTLEDTRLSGIVNSRLTRQEELIRLGFNPVPTLQSCSCTQGVCLTVYAQQLKLLESPVPYEYLLILDGNMQSWRIFCPNLNDMLHAYRFVRSCIGSSLLATDGDSCIGFERTQTRDEEEASMLTC